MKKIEIITDTAIQIAEKINASAIIVFEKIQINTKIPVLFFKAGNIILKDFIQSLDETNVFDKIHKKAENASLKINNAGIIGFINDIIDSNGVIVGIVRMQDSDSIIIYDLSKNETMIKIKECTERVGLDILKSVLKIALQIATNGIEGKHFGTGFIIGDYEEVKRRSHQLVINPFKCQPEEKCDILNESCWNTVKNFSQLDGVFLISEKGIIKNAGRYLDVDAKHILVEKGLGGRHASSAAITRDTEAIAVTVSSTGGIIRIYKDGIEIVKLEPESISVQK